MFVNVVNEMFIFRSPAVVSMIVPRSVLHSSCFGWCDMPLKTERRSLLDTCFDALYLVCTDNLNKLQSFVSGSVSGEYAVYDTQFTFVSILSFTTRLWFFVADVGRGMYQKIPPSKVSKSCDTCETLQKLLLVL